MIKTGSSTAGSPPRFATLALILLISGSPGARSYGEIPSGIGERPPAVSLVLVTLDTTRADFVGVYGGGAGKTPVLDALAAEGIWYSRALSPCPLTLPAHASLLTALDPLEHGLRGNGVAALPEDLPTLATVLADEGYDTAAFVASRVLDRRFGLGSGFALYDDRMAAERIGEYGYPERDAAAVTDAALAWLAGRSGPGRPYFLWVHYYDPHAPYLPPAPWGSGGERERYAGEIAYVDRQIGRLLGSLGKRPRVTAVVGDHGEALGEHGERTHGLFLYRSALEVPLILAGEGVPAVGKIDRAVTIRDLAPTLLSLLGLDPAALGRGEVLPGPVGSDGEAGRTDGIRRAAPEPIYSETLFPARTYGWSPLQALVRGGWKLIAAPRPELYDLAADPGEIHNLYALRPREARRLEKALARYLKRAIPRAGTAPSVDDAELAAALRSLGYLGGRRPGGEGASDGDGKALDPKDGIVLLADFQKARKKLAAGRLAEALADLEHLNRASRDNVPFLHRLGEALLAAGRGREALAAYRRAARLEPALDFLHLSLAHALRQVGEIEEAKKEYEAALALNPRLAAAWLSLAEIAARAGDSKEELRLLRLAEEVETESAAILARLGQIESASDPARAEAHLAEATALAPGWALPWLLRGQLAMRTGSRGAARRHLERAAAAEPASPQAREARRLLGSLE